MRAMLLMVGAVVVLATVRADEVKDREPLQGTWRFVEVHQQGKKDDNLPELRLVFRGDKLGLYRGEKEDKEQFVFSVDPNCTPKAIDIYRAGEKGKAEKLFEGIYAIDGKDLRIAIVPQPGPPWERPSSLAAKDHTKEVLILMRRDEP